MKTLGWMAFQAAIVAAVVWSEVDVGQQLGTKPDFGTALAFGVFLAFLATAAIVAARDIWARMHSSRRSSVPLEVSPISRVDSEVGADGEHLIAPPRGGGDSPKLLGSRRIG